MNLLSSLHLVLRSSFLWALCVIAALSSVAHSQEPINLGHQSWSTENGLPQNSVHRIFQARDGYIWIATEGGVARFNGIDFTTFNHETNPAFTSDDICCFAQDPTGRIWIGTADGLLQYSGGIFRRYSTSDGLPAGEIISLAVADDGTLLILSAGLISRFDGIHFSTLALPGSATPTAMVSADNDNVWIASTSGVFLYQHGNFHSRQLSPLPPSADIQGIGLLPDNSLWLRTGTTLATVQDGTTHTLQIETSTSASRIQTVLAGSTGNLWIGTNKGLFFLDKNSTHPQLQTVLGSNSILSIFQDREGNLWIGTETSGLAILRRQNFRTISGLSDHTTTAIAQASDGAMWVGTNGDGLDRWQSGNVEHFSTRDGLLSEVILALAPAADGSMWIGTPDGLNHIEGSKVKAYTSADGLPDDLIRSLLTDVDGSLWIGTRRGLAHWQNNRFTTLTQADGFKSDLIGVLLQYHSRTSPSDLWIGTLNGLSRLHNGKIMTFTTKDGLSGDVITSLAEGHNGTLWIGTKGGGLSAWSSTGFKSFHRIDLPQEIDSIIEDIHGDLWLGSNRGITRVSAPRLTACGTSPNCDPHPFSYGRSDGMPTEEGGSIGHPASWKSTDGLLWFATRRGVAVVDPAQLAENHIPPPVVIERFTVDDIELPLSTTEQNIAPGHHSFAFQYAGLSYVSPGKVRYRYILEGFDKQWTDAGSRRVAYYTNLPPGHYRFRVQAANNDGLWNEAGAQITFHVEPPFYRRLWFIILALLFIAAIGFLLYRLRIRRLQSKFQAVLAERNRVAREIHDTLAQSFVGVSVQLELTAQLLAQSQVSAAGQQIDNTRKYVREGLAEARRSIWDLRAVTAQHTLPTRLKSLVEQRTGKQLAIQLNVGGSYRQLPPALEDEILRIAQESLTNVVRHANATQASVDLRYHSNRLTLIITDNGHGFAAPDSSLSHKGHFGLQGIRERADQIRAQLTIESSQEKGTTIKLDVPIPAEKGAPNNG
ncbi:sensor histidine kinase [Tunturiibacter lichenicola]|uniref:sensor histidine kinase n=1 Tax=Tunturiibacter lichenicola TaxID=2051959 RepID=UPI0021B4A470|nr:sensor histidine kinase [Edaphobacter lichenicola]